MQSTSQPTNGSSKVTHWVVGEDNVGQRADNFLFARLKGVPKSRVYRALRSGEIRANKKRIKADYRLVLGDCLRLPPMRVSAPTAIVAPSLKLEQTLESAVIFENKQLILVNKPSGIAVHGGSGIRLGLIEAFRQLRPRISYLELVHRLDRETTGCVLLGKKPSVLKELHHQLLHGQIEKTYLALVEGQWQGGEKWVDEPLLKNQLSSGERVVRVHPDGKPSQTRFKPLKFFQQATLMQVTPKTGRTHQIRVHAAHSGHPICGDEKYGQRDGSPLKVPHLLLHAASLHFKLFDELIAISACLDADFQAVLHTLMAQHFCVGALKNSENI